MTEKPRLMFIDFSSIAHPVWHMAANEPDPNATSIGIIAKVRALASNQPHVALCLDSRKSFRKALDATYKASRESKPEPFFHQCQVALETLRGDGFPTWEAEGFEADDVVASAVEAAKVGNWPVMVVSSDKDLLALVNDHLHVKSPITGVEMTPALVRDKFGVEPHQIQDYLAIVGDASDGIVGVKGIGAKGAAMLLQKFGNLDDVYANIGTAENGEVITPAQRTALEAFRNRLPVVRQLLALRTDAPIDFAAVLKERVPDDVATFGEDDIMDDINEAMPTLDDGQFRLGQHPNDHDAFAADQSRLATPKGKQGWRDIGAKAVLGTEPTTELTGDEATKSLGTFVQDVARRVGATDEQKKAYAEAQAHQQAIIKENEAKERPSAALVPVVVDYERQLEPRNITDAKELAKWMFDSRMFSQWGTPQAVMGTILAGRELGISAMASLRAFHVVDGKPTMAADALRALVLKSGKAKSFRCTERTPTAATFVTQRANDEDATTLRYTIEEAQAAGLVRNGSGWTKHPADMLVARASSKLARLVYPDVVAGLYAPEEME